MFFISKERSEEEWVKVHDALKNLSDEDIDSVCPYCHCINVDLNIKQRMLQEFKDKQECDILCQNCGENYVISD